MKLQEVVEKALADKEFAKRLRDLAYRARDEGMASEAYRDLTEFFVETPSDALTMQSTMAYTAAISWTTSKFPGLCTVVDSMTWTIGGRDEDWMARFNAAAWTVGGSDRE